MAIVRLLESVLADRPANVSRFAADSHPALEAVYFVAAPFYNQKRLQRSWQ
jgi:hypothetical protein